mmetsp:Transcript_3892/g.9923  ORF Transcript_3892/g.9923 Transcript_3892/m.9923 type:complete len:234 (-) Transcript_3892:39-740(-)
MVVPMQVQTPEFSPPPIVREVHYKFWRVSMVFFATVCFGRVFGLDLLGSIASALMAYYVAVMLADNCQKMTQHCLMVFGIMCSVNTILELFTLLGAIGGRSTHSTTLASADDSSSAKITYIVAIEKHAFFDNAQGMVYNLQSAMFIASPVSNAFGACLSYWSYNAFPMFQEREEIFAGPAGGYGGLGGAPEPPRFQGGGHYLGSEGGELSPSNQPGVGRPWRLFEGTGQRLGS